MEQRSSEWFEARKKRVTGSVAGAILGLCKWRTPADVMRAMVRDALGAEREFVGNIATEYGQNNEQNALDDFELETGLSVDDVGFVIHPEIDWMGASPDGLVNDDAVLEIKCPYFKRDGGEFLSYIDQPHYYAQMQLEMFCTGRKKCFFYQWSAYSSRIEVIEFSQPWIDANLPRLEAFYQQFLKELKDPERHLAPLVATKSAKDIAAEYDAAQVAFELAKERLEAAKLAMIEAAGGVKSSICGHLVYEVERKGSVSYAKAIKDHLPDLDLEPYTSKPSKYWVIK